MIKYDLLVYKQMFYEFGLKAVNSAPGFVKYFVKEADLQAIAGKIQKRLDSLEDEIDDLDAMLRERENG